jgi:hypothetical protein
MLQQFRFLKEVSWTEVFAEWKATEGADPVWQEFAVREKGWNSWEEWRGHQVAVFGAEKREWRLYEILLPNDTIPKFRIGPYGGWQKHFEKKNVHTFADLAREHTDWISQNIGVRSRLANFPQPTQFIGIYLEQDNVIVLYEGHHRASAIALAVHQETQIEFKMNPTIALTTIKGDATELLAELLAQKSENQARV